jgi:hypothetical protein
MPVNLVDNDAAALKSRAAAQKFSWFLYCHSMGGSTPAEQTEHPSGLHPEMTWCCEQVDPLICYKTVTITK